MIPNKIKKQLEKEKIMKTCIACKSSPVQWHHALQYRGRSMQEPYAIQPLCYQCHMGDSMKPTPYASTISELVAITMGLKDLQNKYPKYDWSQRKKHLERLITTL